MGLLFFDKIRVQLENELKQAKGDIQIISAFCKKEAIKFVNDHIPNSVQKKRLMVRFRLEDILSGASDLEIYNFCCDNGWELYMKHPDLHAKAYIFDESSCIVGSANLTSKGLGLIEKSNYEIAFLSTISEEDIALIDSLFNNAKRIDDDLYKKLTKDAGRYNIDSHVKKNWDESILKLLDEKLYDEKLIGEKSDTKVDSLHVCDFPNGGLSDDPKPEFLDVLGVSPGTSTATLKKAFMRCNAYRWLKSVLEQKEGKEIYYGGLTELIHNAIDDDPKPNRKKIKELQTNFLSWIKELDIDEIQIDRPRHSERIRLLQQKKYSAV